MVDVDGRANGNGNGNHNGHDSGLKLSLLSGRVKTFEAVNFPVSTLADIVSEIRKLNGTGQLTINFHAGKPSGQAEFKRETTKSEGG